MENPKLAADSLLTTGTKVGDLTVYPMTMARYALLELANSPFITKGVDFKLSNLVTTFFIMCSPNEDLRGYNSKNIDDLFDKAMVWSEAMSTDSISTLIDQIACSLGLIKKISPQSGDDKNSSKKDSAQMAG